MKTLIWFILLLFFLFLGAVLGVGNSQEVEVKFFIGTIPPTTLGTILSSTLLTGALIGFFLSLGLIFKLRVENRRLRRQMELSEEEVKNLRNLPIQA